jgi:hypothetical protein
MKEELKNYKLTSLQIHTIETLYYQFKKHLEYLDELCNETEKQDIGIGFALGQMYSVMEENYYKGIALIEAINEQNEK